jgi:CheY-like chemotaxis protein
LRELASPKVLIVEDEWLVRMELVSAFEDEGYAVLESASAEDAIASLQSSPIGAIQLLITDIRLSGPKTGWDVAREARVLDATVGVIYVSANPPSSGHHVADSLFIDKPALVDRVIAAADHLLARG